MYMKCPATSVSPSSPLTQIYPISFRGCFINPLNLLIFGKESYYIKTLYFITITIIIIIYYDTTQLDLYVCSCFTITIISLQLPNHYIPNAVSTKVKHLQLSPILYLLLSPAMTWLLHILRGWKLFMRTTLLFYTSKIHLHLHPFFFYYFISKKGSLSSSHFCFHPLFSVLNYCAPFMLFLMTTSF